VWPKRGEIYKLFAGAGNEDRPVLVVSRDELNRGGRFIAVPFTSQHLETRRSLPNCVLFPKGAFGLWKECVAQADAVTLMEVSELARPQKPIGRVSDVWMKRIIEAISNVVGADLAPPPPEPSDPHPEP